MMTITLLMALTGAAVLPADEPVSEPTPQTLQWVTDISVAREMAAKEGKDILINFPHSSPRNTNCSPVSFKAGLVPDQHRYACRYH